MIIGCSIFKKEIQELNKNQNQLFVTYTPMNFKKALKKNLKEINPALEKIQDDTIIVFDSICPDIDTLNYLVQINPRKRFVFYYWNPVKTSIHPKLIPREYEVWSYSPQDCKEYNLKYNSTFYFASLVRQSEQTLKQDVFTICKNKGRKRRLNQLKREFQSFEISCNFIITATHPKIQKIGYSKSIPYDNVCREIQSSKALLDYYTDSKAGLSLRAMESVFFEKKLITNNETIFNYNFYNKENVFVINRDKKANLNDFINRPYKKINNEIKEYYLFENWIKRFGE